MLKLKWLRDLLHDAYMIHRVINNKEYQEESNTSNDEARRSAVSIGQPVGTVMYEFVAEDGLTKYTVISDTQVVCPWDTVSYVGSDLKDYLALTPEDAIRAAIRKRGPDDIEGEIRESYNDHKEKLKLYTLAMGILKSESEQLIRIGAHDGNQD